MFFCDVFLLQQPKHTEYKLEANSELRFEVEEDGNVTAEVFMNSMKLVIPLHSLYWSIHTKDESKRGSAFSFIFGVN